MFQQGRFRKRSRHRPGMGDLTHTLDYDFLLYSGEAIAKATGIGPDLTYTGNGGTSLIWDENAVLVSTTDNQPRFDHDPVTGAALGLLIEEARTNICLQSEDFTTTWVNINTDEPTTNNTAPDGNTTADEIAATSTADQQFASHQSFTGLTAAQATVCSVYLKAGINATFAQLAWDSDGGGTDGLFCNFNLSTGAKGTVTAFAAGTATSATIQDVGGGFYRCSIIGSIAAGTVGRLTVDIIDQITAAGFEAADLADNDSIIAWGAQIEVNQTFLTSYIPTTTGTVTRTADAPTTTDLTWYNDGGAGTFYAQGSQPVILGNDHLFAISDGTADNRILILQNGSNVTQHFISDGGVTQADLIDSANWADGIEKKAALAFAANDAAAYTDATQTGTDGSVILPTGLNVLYVGANQTGIARWNGHIAKIKYWDVRKTDAFLQAVTA